MELPELSQGLFTIPSLLDLDLSCNLISDVGVALFCQHWNDEAPLQELDMATNHITAVGATQLLQASARHAAFFRLDISGNVEIGHGGLEQIGQELPNIGLTHLVMQQCVKPLAWPSDSYEQAVVDAACRSLSDGLRHNTSLVKLEIGGNSLGARGAQMLMQAIAGHPTLELLSLASDKSIGFLGMKLIGMELAHTKLKEIVLNDLIPDAWPNPQTPAAIAAGQALLDGQNETLSSFDLTELPAIWNAPIQFYVRWNAICRPLLRSEVAVPALWPYVLECFQDENNFSETFMILREQPWLVAAATATTTTIAPKGY
jgi:hypothetical protein